MASGLTHDNTHLDALTGHASRDVGDGYGLGYPLPVLVAAIARLPRDEQGRTE